MNEVLDKIGLEFIIIKPFVLCFNQQLVGLSLVQRKKVGNDINDFTDRR